MRRMTRRLCVGALVVCALAMVAAACVELDTAWRGQTLSLGEEIYRIVCERLASEEIANDLSGRRTRALCAGDVGVEMATTPRMRALVMQRSRLVTALNQVVPDTLQANLRSFLARVVPLYDPPSERFPAVTRAAANVVSALLTDADARTALERLGRRRGYRPLPLGLGVVRPVVAYSGLNAFNQRVFERTADGGPAADAWRRVLEVSALEMATAGDEGTPVGESTLEVARELLFRENAAFGTSTPRLIVRRDARGYVMVEPPMLGTLFIDADADGLVDVDATGRITTMPGLDTDSIATPFLIANEASASRDSLGRAQANGALLYQYRDMDQTLLAGLVREGRGLSDPATPAILDLLAGVANTLGPRTPKTERFGNHDYAYTGFDTARGPLFDLLHAQGQLMDLPVFDDVLVMAKVLLEQHEAEVAGLINAGLFLDARADEHSEAALEQPNELWDDLNQVLTWSAQEPGLMEALLRSFADPRTRRLGHILAELMTHKDLVTHDPDDLNNVRDEVVFMVPVDRNAPDTFDNRSLFQRTLALMHELYKAPLCSKQDAVAAGLTFAGPECSVLHEPDQGQAFALSIIGRYELHFENAFLEGVAGLPPPFNFVDTVMETDSGIDGLTTHPTPYALARLIFAPRTDQMNALLKTPPTNDDVPAEDRHPGTIFAWERQYTFDDGLEPAQATLYDAMTPTLEAFDDFDRRTEGRFLFLEMMTAFYHHWESRYEGPNQFSQNEDASAPFFSHQDNGRSYEALVASGIGDLIERVHRVMLVLDEIEVRPGVDGIDVLAEMTEHLVDPQKNVGMTYRDGRSETPSNAGSRMIAVTPMYETLDALNGFDAAFQSDAPRLARWRAGRSRAVDQLLTMQASSSGEHAFANRRTHAALLAVIDFLRARLQVHRDASDLDSWALGLSQRLEATLGSAQSATALDLVEALQSDPATREEIAKLTMYLLDQASGNDASDVTLAAVGDLLQLWQDERNLDPVLRALSVAMAPNAREVVGSGGSLNASGSTVDAVTKLLRELSASDTDGALQTMMTNLMTPPAGPSSETPLETIMDVIGEINRVSAGQGGNFDATDYNEMLGRSQDFLSNPHRGIERFFRVVQGRELP